MTKDSYINLLVDGFCSDQKQISATFGWIKVKLQKMMP